MRATYDVAIAGAGIVGAACAAECAAAGLKVVVVEPGPIGGGATAAGMGHIVVMDDSPAQFALTHYSRTLWRELAPRASGRRGIRRRRHPLGGGRRRRDGRGAAQARGLRPRRRARRGARMPQALAEAEPNLRRGLAGGLLVPDDAVIYPPCAARFLLEQARARGAVLRAGAAAASLSEQRHHAARRHACSRPASP